jgi:solute carrier family 8 (sodium/calcium exchanger)
MALGSSAPEILLSVIETVKSLGECPGELGASTIVGSASFNLLVISAVSLYAVNEDNDNDPDRDDSVPLGVKKINDMGVFGVTSISSVLAYILMWVCLMDQQIELYEGIICFVLFFILIGMAFAADKWNEMKQKKNKPETEDGPVI